MGNTIFFNLSRKIYFVNIRNLNRLCVRIFFIKVEILIDNRYISAFQQWIITPIPRGIGILKNQPNTATHCLTSNQSVSVHDITTDKTEYLISLTPIKEMN